MIKDLNEISSEEFHGIVTSLLLFTIPATEHNLSQWEVFMDALSVYNERTAAYNQVWQQYGAISNLLSAARKIDRLMEIWWRGKGEVPALHKDNLDDAIDALNYLAFFIQNAREGNITGSAPKRPAK